MKNDHSQALKRHVIPLLRAAYISAAEAPKTEADDLMLEFCDDLLSIPPARAREFYANPLAAPPDQTGSFYTAVREDTHTLFRHYRRRAQWLSLEERSPRRLLTGLLAFALSWEDVSDWRDLLVALAPFHHCARVLEMDIPRLFDQAGRYALPELTPHYETFGRRKDVTLGTFGWVAVETDYGVRLREG